MTEDDLRREFGEDVALLVDGVTKLEKIPLSTPGMDQSDEKLEMQAENLRKMFLAMSKDIRVILIKIADRLHNTRTLQYQTPEKQRSKSLETMEIYAPLAHRLGMQRVKWELEDTSLRYLDPVGYAEITRELSAKQAYSEAFMSHVQEKLEERMAQMGIHCTIYGRIKHIYSIYRKMYNQNKQLDEARTLINDVRKKAQRSIDGGYTPQDLDPFNANYNVGLYPSEGRTQEYARKAVRMERRLELAMEGNRWFDLLRWNTAVSTVNAYMQSEQRYHTYYAGNSISEDELYFPVPYEEVNNSNGLYK